MRRCPLLAVLLATFVGGCVVSKTPVTGLGERAAPVPSGTALDIFERNDANSPWKAGEQKSVQLVAGADRVYRSVDAEGKREDDGVVFYPLALGRYLVEAQFGAARYGYAVLQAENGTGLLTPLDCKSIPAATLKSAGMKIAAGDCWLEDTKDPAGFLKSIAAAAPAASVKYVPQKAK